MKLLMLFDLLHIADKARSAEFRFPETLRFGSGWQAAIRIVRRRRASAVTAVIIATASVSDNLTRQPVVVRSHVAAALRRHVAR